MSAVAPNQIPLTPLGRHSRRGEPTWEIALLYPEQGMWTESAYLALGTKRMVELSDGCLEILPMPTAFHQYILLFVLDALRAFVKQHAAGHVLPAPLPVWLWQGKFREPDIVYCKPERIPDMHGQPKGADLAVEIVSPGEDSRERDLKTKRQEYAAAGISEYWIVDPDERHIVVLTLAGNTYREHGTFKVGSQATSLLLPGFAIDVAAMFAAGEQGV